MTDSIPPLRRCKRHNVWLAGLDKNERLLRTLRNLLNRRLLRNRSAGR